MPARKNPAEKAVQFVAWAKKSAVAAVAFAAIIAASEVVSEDIRVWAQAVVAAAGTIGVFAAKNARRK